MPRIALKKRCVGCGTTFETDVAVKVSCSKACSAAAWKRKNRERYKAIKRRYVKTPHGKVVNSKGVRDFYRRKRFGKIMSEATFVYILDERLKLQRELGCAPGKKV